MHVSNVMALTWQPSGFARSSKRSEARGQMCGFVRGVRIGAWKREC